MVLKQSALCTNTARLWPTTTNTTSTSRRTSGLKAARSRGIGSIGTSRQSLKPSEAFSQRRGPKLKQNCPQKRQDQIFMNLQLNGKTALVTGSTAGIGFAIAQTLASEGANVIVNGRTQPRVEEALSGIQKAVPGAKVDGIAADLGKAEGCESVLRKFPQVDILVNNLGIFEPKAFEQIPDADWVRLFEVNVMSGVRLSRAYLPGMKQRNWGRIVFISSESGVQIPAEMVHYGMTKAAQIAVARGMAETCAGTAVTVNSVLAGPTASEGVTEFVSALAKE